MAEYSKYCSNLEIRELICEVGRRMYHKNFVAANDGNISVKTGPDAIWTTPTGVSKGYMTPDMMVKMNLSGKIMSGTLEPSSEIKMHVRVYRENPEVRAVVHAHPPVATSHAIAGIALDKPILTEAILTLGVVPIAPYATPGSPDVPDSIAPFCKDYNAVLLANHGALTWGTDLMQAYFRMESLEHYAHILMYTTNVIKRCNQLNCSKISDLIAIREKMGITAGGFPPCSAEKQDARLTDEEIQEIIRSTLQ